MNEDNNKKDIEALAREMKREYWEKKALEKKEAK